jgi:hypothetical protein
MRHSLLVTGQVIAAGSGHRGIDPNPMSSGCSPVQMLQIAFSLPGDLWHISPLCPVLGIMMERLVQGPPGMEH